MTTPPMTDKDLKTLSPREALESESIRIQERWRNVRPIAVLSGSEAQCKNIFIEMKEDLFKLVNAYRSGHLIPSDGRVEELEAENARLREALEPFATWAELEGLREESDYFTIADGRKYGFRSLRMKELRTARAALQKEQS